MSKSQLQRISAMEKLTAGVKSAVDDKSISESAALAMSNLTAQEQEACLEKILSGEMSGTAADIQNLGTSAKGAASAVGEAFEDPQKEAKDWFYRERLAAYEAIYMAAKRSSEEEADELKAAQWEIRASVARYNIEELKLERGE